LVCLQSVVIIALQQFEGFGVRIFGCHDYKWNKFSFAELGLKRMDILAVILEETFPSEKFIRYRDFDSIISESFSKSSCNQNECSLLELFKTDALVLLPCLEVTVGNSDSLRLADLIIFVGVDSESRFLE
jgi:hypothetical protein